jgi:hypothetical protein
MKRGEVFLKRPAVIIDSNLRNRDTEFAAFSLKIAVSGRRRFPARPPRFAFRKPKPQSPAFCRHILLLLTVLRFLPMRDLYS